MNESEENESRRSLSYHHIQINLEILSIICDKLVTCAAESVSLSVYLPVFRNLTMWKGAYCLLCTAHTTYSGLMEMIPQDGNGNEKNRSWTWGLCVMNEEDDDGKNDWLIPARPNSTRDERETDIKNSINILLCGAPRTSKSQLLQHTARTS